MSIDAGSIQQLSSVAQREFRSKAPSDIVFEAKGSGDFMILEADWLATDGTVVSGAREVPAVNPQTAMIEVVRNARELADEMSQKKRDKLTSLIKAAKGS